MKKPTEKQPIDELFARKLGNMSLPPKADGFERLQARMGQGKPEAKVVLWNNPSLQRYMAAACLVLVCLFGWLYWPTSHGMVSDGTQVDINKPVGPKQTSIQHQKEHAQPAKSNEPDIESPALPEQKAVVEQLAKIDEPSINKANSTRSSNKPINTAEPSFANVATANKEPVLAQTKSVETKSETSTSADVTPMDTSPTEQLVDNKPIAKPTPAVERVLVVTIAEPEALVAARQAAVASVEEKSTVAAAEKSVKESKANSLWQQVKRIKQGEVLARGDNSDSESSLLGRAYSGLKHSLEKDKSAKQ